MSLHEKKHCPRCAAVFVCESTRIEMCQCTQIELTTEELEYNNKVYQGCLCLACLKALRTEFNQIASRENEKC